MKCPQRSLPFSPERAPEERTAPPALRRGAAEKAEVPAMAAQRMAVRSIASKTDWFSFRVNNISTVFVFLRYNPKKSPPGTKIQRKCWEVKMGYESLHAAATDGDDQELRKRAEGLDIDRS